jgi:type IV secretory pathway TraG/TraD family ATPase VirD4
MIRRILKKIAILVVMLSVLAALWCMASAALWAGLTTSPFSPLGWFAATIFWRANWYVNLCLFATAVVPALLIVPVLVIGTAKVVMWRGRTLTDETGSVRLVRRGMTDNLGHAAFATDAQLVNFFPAQGCLIGARNRGTSTKALLFDNINVGPGHNLIIAGSGSDKTSTAITRIWNWLGPRVVFDPSSLLSG